MRAVDEAIRCSLKVRLTSVVDFDDKLNFDLVHEYADEIDAAARDLHDLIRVVATWPTSLTRFDDAEVADGIAQQREQGMQSVAGHVLAALNDRQRMLLLLSMYDSLTHEQIAEGLLVGFADEFPWLDQVMSAIIPLHYFPRSEAELIEYLESVDLTEQQHRTIENWWLSLDGGEEFFRQHFEAALLDDLSPWATRNAVEDLLSEMDNDDWRWFLRDAFDFHPNRWIDTEPHQAFGYFFEAVITSTSVGEQLEELEETLEQWYLSDRPIALFCALGDSTRNLALQVGLAN